jgi:L-fuculose-phosphate aldolase
MAGSEYTHPRDEILQVMERIYRYRMTTTSGGNISVREPDGALWITPARVDKGTLRREDIVLVRADGVVEGRYRPSSEYPFHAAVYAARPDYGAVVHAHPTALVAFSMAHQMPDTRLFHQAKHVCGDPGFARYELPGTEQLGKTVAAVFARGSDCVVLENHGVVTGGANLAEAFHRFETLEFTAKTIIKAWLLDRPVFLDDSQLTLAREGAGNLREFTRDAPGSVERELRRTLCEFVRRAYRQRLFISTQGSFSARLGANEFLITPYAGDRGLISPEGLVLIRDGAAESGKHPSRACILHEFIYRAHPRVSAIINAYPVNATAFSVTDQGLDSRTIPESYVVLREVGRAPFGVQFRAPGELAGMISEDRPAIVLQNDGVLVTGSTVVDAYDRLEVLEATAEAIINARAIGGVTTMPPAVIEELDRVFLGKEP